MTRRTNRGFTLLELMVTVVILSILATVAVFSYKRYSQRARTQEAINFLYEIKLKQETYYQSYGQYVTTGKKPGIVPSRTMGEEAYEWSTDCQNGDANDLAWCDLGARVDFDSCTDSSGKHVDHCSHFNFQTVGWAPGAADPGDVSVAQITLSPIIKDPSRRWWYAWAVGNLDMDKENQYSGFVLTSEQNQVIDLWNGSRL